MLIRSVDLVQAEGTHLEWRLEGFTLRQVNLIVGKNATGKTRALGAVGNMANLVSGQLKPTSPSQRDVYYSAHLADNGSGDVRYKLRIAGGNVVEERFLLGEEQKLQRGHEGAGRMYFERLGQHIEFQSPADELACVSRRDSIQHPYLEKLYQWGRRAHRYRFNSAALGKGNLISLDDRIAGKAGDLAELNPSSVPVQLVYYVAEEKLGERFKASLKDDMRRLGYPLLDTGLRAYKSGGQPSEGEDAHLLFVSEEGIGAPIDQLNMSDGMFRALSILIYVTYAAMLERPSCVIIDDIGEGLDYERSCLLIKLLIEKAQQTGVQLVMATNDRFVMNNVPLEHWTVLARAPGSLGTRIEVYNYETHKALFDAFSYTGLNNFDFLATGFFEGKSR